MTENSKNPFRLLEQDPIVFGDERGRVSVLYETERVVLKRSTSSKGVLRGLHRQTSPALQDKIIRVVQGSIFDFVTNPDISDDPIWYREVTPDTGWIHIRNNLAHGFYAHSNVEFEYFCDGRYDSQSEETYFVADAIIRDLGLKDVLLSEKDKSGKVLERPLQKVI